MEKKRLLILFTVALSAALIIFASLHYKSKVTFVPVDDQLSPSEYKKSEVISYPEDKIFVYFFNGKIDVYIKGNNNQSNKYVGYHIRNFIEDLNIDIAKSNYNVWNISSVNEFERRSADNFYNLRKIVTTGEWDTAIKEKNASDFIGGTQHGDEVTTEISFFIDDQAIEKDSHIKQDVNSFTLIAKSDLFRDNTLTDEIEKIATSEKKYHFDINGLTIDRKITFDEELELEKSYLAMLPILRKSNGEVGEQITDSIITSYDNESYDVSNSGFSIPQISNIQANKVNIFGKDNGISATVEIKSLSPDYGMTFKLSNSELYNKLYFAFIQDGHKTTPGEVWEQTTHYKIDTSN